MTIPTMGPVFDVMGPGCETALNDEEYLNNKMAPACNTASRYPRKQQPPQQTYGCCCCCSPKNAALQDNIQGPADEYLANICPQNSCLLGDANCCVSQLGHGLQLSETLNITDSSQVVESTVYGGDVSLLTYILFHRAAAAASTRGNIDPREKGQQVDSIGRGTLNKSGIHRVNFDTKSAIFCYSSNGSFISSDLRDQNKTNHYSCNISTDIKQHNPTPNNSIEIRRATTIINDSMKLISFILLLSIITSNNAQTCHCFNSPEPVDVISSVNCDNISQRHPQPSVTFVNPFTSQWTRHIRSFMFPDDVTPEQTRPPASFSQDQLNGPQQSQAPSWTSMLTNPFSNGGSQQLETDSLDTHIKNILVPRVSGTAGNIQVREYIVDALKRNNYKVELDEFTSSTPIGNVKFANIIARSNPNACRQLVLACHYDSKLTPNGFLGATDSAVPCAMLLKISERFNDSFRAPPSNDNVGDDNEPPTNSLGLEFIFFDGEEAFIEWSSTDSLYGSRHLAAKWAQEAPPHECQLGSGPTGVGLKNELGRIELFVLLDLIGASDSSFVMYNKRLRHHYEALQKYEKDYMVHRGFTQARIGRESAFRGRTLSLDFIEDDHVPFRQRGVPILSLLAHPFPRVWHTMNDNYQAIDFPRTRRILYAIEEFVENYPNTNKQG